MDQSKQTSSAANKALISAIKNQVKNNEPPETKLTYFRLLGLGRFATTYGTSSTTKRVV